MINEEFVEKVYDCVRLIPFGKVSTFCEIAKVLGGRYHSLKVRKVVNKVNIASIPFYRVVDRDGGLQKDSRRRRLQKSMLELESVEVCGNKVDLQKYGFYFW